MRAFPNNYSPELHQFIADSAFDQALLRIDAFARARALRDAGDTDGRSLQMACHIADFVRKGDPDNRDAWLLWRDLFQARMATEPALMPRGAFHSAVRDAEARLAELGPLPNP